METDIALIPLHRETIRTVLGGLNPGETIDEGIARQFAPSPGNEPKTVRPPSHSRGTARYVGVVLGEEFEADKLPEALETVLLRLNALDSEFLPRLSWERARSRRYVARKPEALYPSPHLSSKYREILPGWFIPTNIGQRDLERALVAACRISGLTYGVDVNFRKSTTANLDLEKLARRFG